MTEPNARENGAPPVWISSAVRTAIGKLLGGLSPLSAPKLGALVVREAVERARVPADAVDEVILGNVLSAGLGQNPARQAALGAGLPAGVGALTINKVCGSGLKAVMLARQAILAGDAEVVVAGGMESMSNAPHLVSGMRAGSKLGDGSLVDSMVHDGLTDAFEDIHMGETAERVADRHGVSREAMDEYAAESQRRAHAATEAGRFAAEILPVEVPARRRPARKGTVPKRTIVVERDESIRPDATAESLARLKPVFRKDGRVTAGNAPGVNDGASALVIASDDAVRRRGLPRLARITGQAVSGLEPEWVMMTPVPAVRKLLDRLGWSVDGVDIFEINEAFAAQAVAVRAELGLPADRTNLNGGAVALGHPIGASGARILTTLLHLLRERQADRGVASLCLGGGNGVALGVERA